MKPLAGKQCSVGRGDVATPKRMSTTGIQGLVLLVGERRNEYMHSAWEENVESLAKIAK